MKVIVHIDIFVKVLIMLMATQKRPKKAKKKVIKMKYIRIKIRHNFFNNFPWKVLIMLTETQQKKAKNVFYYM